MKISQVLVTRTTCCFSLYEDFIIGLQQPTIEFLEGPHKRVSAAAVLESEERVNEIIENRK